MRRAIKMQGIRAVECRLGYVRTYMHKTPIVLHCTFKEKYSEAMYQAAMNSWSTKSPTVHRKIIFLFITGKQYVSKN